MVLVDRGRLLGGSLALMLASWTGISQGAPPTAEQALKLTPVQKDVEFSRPSLSDAARATIKAEDVGGQTGWVVRDPAGQILRKFVDTNSDNVVDLWCYFEDGLEVYRDIDSNYNGKADQYRWLNTAGIRWGVDNDEDGRIDVWKSISAEEVSSEVVAALSTSDTGRFTRLLITDKEITGLGLGAAKSKELSAKISAAPSAFKNFTLPQKGQGQVTQAAFNNKTKWVHFGGTRPGLVPAGTDGATKDVTVYENVVAMVETDAKHGQVLVGTLVKVGDTWRMIDAPQPLADNQADLSGSGFFFQGPLANRPDVPVAGNTGGVDIKVEDFLRRLEKLDKVVASTPNEEATLNKERADLMEQIADASSDPKDRTQWYMQMADTLQAAVQSGNYAPGVERLRTLSEKLAKDGDKDLSAYVEFRFLTAENANALQSEGVNYPEVQAKWLVSLQKFVENHPQSADAPEAILQLAISEEFSGQEDGAKKWYGRLVSGFASSTQAKKASGALTRLNCVGKVIKFQGKDVSTGKPVDLQDRALVGKAVLIQYWATWCGPAKADMAQIRELQAKFAKDGLVVIGVNLDAAPKDLQEFLKKNRLPWPQVWEPGGLDSRFANELGILSLPTMILIDKQGKVANRGIHVTELEKEISAVLR
jgi:thiol-disulfide isomerase/thioredoxin